MLRRSCIGFLIAALLTALSSWARAQTPSLPVPPQGWQSNVTDLGWLVSSPQTPQGQVVFLMPLVMDQSGDFAADFANDVPGIVEATFGETVSVGQVSDVTKFLDPGQVLAYTHVVRGSAGADARILVMGYRMPEGAQLMFILSPGTMPEDDPVVGEALRYAEGVRSLRFALTAERLTGSPVQEPTPSDTPPGPDGSTSSDFQSDAGGAIETVIYHTRRYLGRLIPTTTLLLKNGRAFSEDPRAPADFDPATRHPTGGSTGAWRKTADTYEITWDEGGTVEVAGANGSTRPAAAGETISGRFSTSMASDNLRWADVITLGADGRLVSSRADGVVTGTGTYRLDGRTIEIALGGQGHRRWLFGVRDDAQGPAVLVIGDVVFTRD